VFGTYNATGDKVPETYGVDDPIPSSYFGQVGYPLMTHEKRSNHPVPSTEA